MMESYNEMLVAAKDNIKTSFCHMGKCAVLQVIDTIIGTKAANQNQASASGINAPAQPAMHVD